ncbi:ABC-type uncharacterized transport system, auxiliary component [Sedimentisphaera cyanobacteriorum]|uniref:ABC-type uncharacterized transport system, auxiliary component n=1 Tax=Sedimentisphaera cyanobacteriorum TaxID=1940790 RepID=A0A1Q2HMW9_9BACT|nr:hypothetical protein [Sedimentisphaera cyanobacteriorum]AQQ08792.1 ABC-type uncharacterized transport system, auxiliary component [Sedimentisphaera cyanobacteriorum]
MRQLIIILTAAFMCGCASETMSVKDLYLLEPDLPEESLEAPELPINVGHFYTADAFDYKNFTYRKAEGVYEIDHYRKFISPKNSMVQSRLSQWLDSIGFNVQPENIKSEYIITGIINEFYADFENKPKPEAVIELKIFISTRNADPISSKTFKARKLIREADEKNTIDSWEQCLEEIFPEAAQFISNAVKARLDENQ